MHLDRHVRQALRGPKSVGVFERRARLARHHGGEARARRRAQSPRRAGRGAVGSLTAEVLEGHIRPHIVDPEGDTKRARAAAALIEALKTYVR